MAGNSIQLKRSSVAGRVPDANDVLVGEPVINLFDKIIFTKDGNGDVIVVGAGTTSNVLEGSNLYFTNARSRASISVTGSGSYNSSTGVITITGGVESVNGANGTVVLSTTNISEGDNLYYTVSRANSAIDNRVNKTFIDNLNVDADTLDGLDASAFALDSDLTTANVTELTNLYFTNARTYSNVTSIGYATNSNVALKANIVDLTTANVTELTNLYFTNARVYSNVTSIGYATNTNVALKANVVDLTTTNVIEAQNLYFTTTRVQANVVNYLTGDSVKTISGNLNITGNLNIAGSITTFTSNIVEIQDPMIYLGTGNSGDVNDIGFVGHFTNPDYQHTGFVRDASDGVWKLFANVLTEPTNNTLDFTNATYSTIKVGNLLSATAAFTGNVTTGNVSTTRSIATYSNLGTVQSGTWNGSSISTTYTDAKVTSVNGQTGAATGFATTANSLSQFASTTSAQLATLISDETGSGSLVFATSPTLAGLTSTGTTTLTTVGANTTPALRVGDTLNRSINFLANIGGGSYTPITNTDDSLIYFTAGAMNTGNLLIAPWGSYSHGIKLNPVGNAIYLYGNIIASSNISSVSGVITGNLTAGNFQSAGNVNAASALYTGSVTAGTLQTAGAVNSSSGTISSGSGRIAFLTDAGGSISLGNVSSQGASTPYIDFNSGATTVDYDTRIQGTGGTGVVGKGTLTFTAATSAFTANVTAGNVALNSNGVLRFPDGTFQTTKATSVQVTVATVPPSSPNVGDAWIDSNTSKKYLYYYDGTSYQWVEEPTGVFVSSAVTSVGGATGTISNAQIVASLTGLDISVGNITSSGTITSPNFYSQSDITLKQDITVIANPLEKLSSISGVNFKWKNNNTKSVGVIAQEIEKVLPEAVSIDMYGYKIVSYDTLIPLLIESIKTLKSELDILKNSR